ncbi:hypothetical protein HO816_10345, partial [Streptococcus suis]|nr:hypothetical protein [Streptococcus suis]
MIYLPIVFALITDFVSEYARHIVKIATSDHKPNCPNWTILDVSTKPINKDNTESLKTSPHHAQN